MSCSNCNKLCKRLVISTAVTFTGGNLVINLPQNNYANREKYCIVVAQTIPDTTTVAAPVVITIGDDAATTYPLVYCDGTAVSACSINTRTRYSTIVRTDITGGVFSLTKKLPCSHCIETPSSLPLADTTTTTVVAPTEAVELRTTRNTPKAQSKEA